MKGLTLIPAVLFALAGAAGYTSAQSDAPVEPVAPYPACKDSPAPQNATSQGFATFKFAVSNMTAQAANGTIEATGVQITPSYKEVAAADMVECDKLCRADPECWITNYSDEAINSEGSPVQCMLFKNYSRVTWWNLVERPYNEVNHFEGTSFRGLCEEPFAQSVIKNQTSFSCCNIYV